jgi:glycosyltransferase involved in cell wall biosynthesis
MLKNICALIPVYNHPDTLPSLVHCLTDAGLSVILIDDGSNVANHQHMQRLVDRYSNVQLITHGINRGKGAAVKTGLRIAREAGFSHALQVDADGQHELGDIPRFIEASKRQPQALVVGYPRYDETVPKVRYYSRFASHIWVWINTLSKTIKDSMCGFRIYPVESSCQIIESQKMGDRMDFDGEFVVRWYWTGLPLDQIETKVVYPEKGVSHFRLFHDNRLISWMHARLFFGMLIRLPTMLSRKWRNL